MYTLDTPAVHTLDTRAVHTRNTRGTHTRITRGTHSKHARYTLETRAVHTLDTRGTHTRHTRAIPSSLTNVCEVDFGRDDPAAKPVMVVIRVFTLKRQACLFDGCAARFAVPA